MLSQLLRLQVVEEQGHFALFAEAWAAQRGRGARAPGAQAGGKEGQGTGWVRGGGREGEERGSRTGWGGLTHRVEESPRLLWAELPSCSTVAQKRPITSSS